MYMCCLLFYMHVLYFTSVYIHCFHVHTFVLFKFRMICTVSAIQLQRGVNYNAKKSRIFQSKVCIVLSVSTDCRKMEAISVNTAVVYDS